VGDYPLSYSHKFKQFEIYVKKLSAILIVLAFGATQPVYAQSWWDSIKSAVGMGDETAAAAEESASASGLVSMIADNLSVNEEQAEGGMGSIFGFVQQHATAENFEILSGALPGLSSLLGEAPDVSEEESSGGLGGLLDKASEYNESLKAVNTVKKQFEALGIDPEMITDFVKQAQTYLDTEEGQEAKKVLTDSFSKFLG
jgi:hypothetical protein